MSTADEIILLTDEFTKINSVYFQAVGQAFKCAGTNAFNITNLSVHGSGIPSEFNNTTMGGNISGCNFEDASGRLTLNYTHGINITGCYFEGYSESLVDTYIDCKEYVTGINISGNMFYKGAKQAIMMDQGTGISITGNNFGTLNAVKLKGDTGQRRINYQGNFWYYEGTSLNPSEFTGNSPLSGKENVSPEWNVPVIFSPQVFKTRQLEQGEHKIEVSPITDSSTNENYLLHTWEKNGKISKAFLNGSIDLFSKDFNQNESLDVSIEPFGFGSTLGTLIIQNASFEFAMFLWQRNINDFHKTGKFKQIVNELNVELVHHDGYFTVKNNGESQYLKAELKA